jgi:uncharacterized coiled-coil protein SlyX
LFASFEIFINFIFQNVIIAVPNELPVILEQLKELQQHIQSLETESRKLMDENDNFKRQIEGLIESKVVLIADIEDKIANQNDKITSQNDKIASQNNKIASQNDKITSQNDKIASQNDKITSQNDKIASQNDKIDKTAVSVEEMKNSPKAVVAFRTTCTKNFQMSTSGKTRYNSENPVIWKYSEYNIGSAFDASNGKFTCPHNGIYSFYATSPIVGRYGKIYIYVNGRQKIDSGHNSGHIDANTAIEHASSQSVLQLTKGDTVHIHMKGYFNLANTYCHSTYFQGHLIDLL